ncbi:3-methyladenine DNA glycosylase [Microbacterium sorbitolivorans]|uniref:DNA-3-methyladenine glycosylase I n=1 Tax=Microbacterium sorbitolivorans TaxID=1867410 RepID=A0A367XUX8_9MICO|nr:DNA-3-methyladenine glycosylase I [Microbacterium sorbitolivorans]RCK57020.1 DNA-3-methyladenine glycosylase I [Microbacterium sorbitolivorans]GGF47350.1 3-methyladenine DNA glycosylase [Microbacterium sorbitolivorans]
MSDFTFPAGFITGSDGVSRPPWAEQTELLRDYYDTEWGVAVTDEQGVFERLSLEAFQSGLSWVTVLRKRPAFREAFAGFDPDAVAAFDEADVERLMANEGIIRNHAKILATIDNARATVALRETGTDLAKLVWSFRPENQELPTSLETIPSTSPESLALSKTLKAAGFRWVGPTTMFALMEAIGLVPKAQRPFLEGQS